MVNIGEDNFVEFAREAEEVLLVSIYLQLTFPDFPIAVELILRAASHCGTHAQVSAGNNLEGYRRGQVEFFRILLAEVPVV